MLPNKTNYKYGQSGNSVINKTIYGLILVLKNYNLVAMVKL